MKIEEALSAITRRPAWGERYGAIGTSGYTLPQFDSPRLIKAEDNDSLAHFGITLEGDAGSDNIFIIDEKQPKLSLTCRIRGCSGTTVIVGLGRTFKSRLAFNGQNSLFVSSGFANMGQPSHINVVLGPGCAAFLGAGLTSVFSEWTIEGMALSLIIGDDFMASWGISAKNFDSHALFDIEDERVLNAPRSLHIGPHSWIGQDARIIRGVEVGMGAVIGAGALVNADIPALSAVGGAPARVIRTGVSWTRSANPSPAEISTVKRRLADYARAAQNRETGEHAPEAVAPGG